MSAVEGGRDQRMVCRRRLGAELHWLRLAALAWRREMDTRLRPLGPTHTQFDVLASTSWLGRTDGAPTQQEVADFAVVDRMMTSKIVRTLLARGLIARTPHAARRTPHAGRR
ncbi:DNA-binding MarR family transcriptional regulator [Nakamurella sp. UYEF19]|uniref:MarR family winged helix-turn-helix transcriptional regulator n=1 Tax=Nakamurella sp. UYEF19 TaxID=1756392 RepID=UPI003397FB53